MTVPQTPQDKIDDASADFQEVDHRRVAKVGQSLKLAEALRTWWCGANNDWLHKYKGEDLAKVVQSEDHQNYFHLTRAHPLGHDTEANFGFFGEAPLDGQPRPVMGLFQQTFFDQPRGYFVEKDRAAQLDRWQRDLRAFVLDYLIRLTGFYETAPYVDPKRRPVDPESLVRLISWCPNDYSPRGGFGFSQLYYQTRNGRIGKFREADRPCVDLNTVRGEGRKYDWIVVGIRIHDLYLRYPGLPWITASIADEVLAVLTERFIVCEEKPSAGVRARYGFGYAVLDDPEETNRPLSWHRPAFGFQINEFVVQDGGRILARSTMVTDKLQRVLSINPAKVTQTVADRAALRFLTPAINTGLEMLDAATPGVLQPLTRGIGDVVASQFFDPFSTFAALAGTIPLDLGATLCMTRDDVIRSLLSDFVRSQLETIFASRGVWRAVPEWSDPKRVPDWVPKV